MTIYDEIIAERARQDAKWGEQNWPSVGGPNNFEQLAEFAKASCNNAMHDGTCTFFHIANEELLEAAAARDDVERRRELVQLAAVCVQWIEAIDRRAAK